MVSFTVFIAVVILLDATILWLLYRRSIDQEIHKIFVKSIITLEEELDYKNIIIGYFTVKYGEIKQEDFDSFIETHKNEINNISFPPTSSQR